MINFTHDEIAAACPFKLLSFSSAERGIKLIIEWEYEFCGKAYRYGRAFNSNEYDRAADKKSFKAYELAICERHMKEVANHQPQ